MEFTEKEISILKNLVLSKYMKEEKAKDSAFSNSILHPEYEVHKVDYDLHSANLIELDVLLKKIVNYER